MWMIKIVPSTCGAMNARPAENAIEKALEGLDTGGLDVKKKRRFKVKGVPKDMQAHVVR